MEPDLKPPAFTDLYEKVYARLHWIWLWVAMPVSFTMVFLTPPFQAPDEATHFFRAAQVSIGVWMGKKGPDGIVGGEAPAGAVSLVEIQGFNAIPFHPDRKTDVVNATQTRPYLIEWGDRQMFVANPNTILWPPTGYIPQAIGLKLGRALRLNVLASYYLARLINCLVCVLTGFAAIRFAVNCKWFLTVVLAMPMTLFEFGSVSQDAVLFAFAALGASLLSVLLDWKEARARDLWIMGGVFLLFTMLCMARSPYTAILPATAFLVAFNQRHLARPAILIGFIGVVGVIAWLVAVSPLITTFGHGDNPWMQLRHIAGAPLQFLQTLRDTCVLHSWGYVISFIGCLGWLDLLLARDSYLFYLILLGLTAVSGVIFSLKTPGSSRVNFTAVLSCSLASGLLVIVSQYLMWTEVGASVIEGVQGRYFIPIALFASLAVRDGEFTFPAWKYISALLAVFAISTVYLVNIGAIFRIIERYYY